MSGRLNVTLLNRGTVRYQLLSRSYESPHRGDSKKDLSIMVHLSAEAPYLYIQQKGLNYVHTK